MRIIILSIIQRSNTFSRSPGKLSLSSTTDSLLLNQPVIRQVIEESGIELVHLRSSLPRAAGPIPEPIFSNFLNEIKAVLSRYVPFDAILLDASGCLVVGETSGEERLLSFLLEQWPKALLGSYFDHVAQFPASLLDLTPLVIGPQTWPPQDRTERLSRALRFLVTCLRTGRLPHATLYSFPLLPPLAIQRTDIPPFGDFQEKLRAIEHNPGVAAATLFAGFPYADVSYAGSNLLLVSSGQEETSSEFIQMLASELLAQLELVPWPMMTIEEALHTSLTTTAHLTLVLDTGDAPEAGGPGEGTAALWAALDLGIRESLLVGIVDSETVQLALERGPGSPFTTELGGKQDHRHGYPIPVEGKVHRVFTGHFRSHSPLHFGEIVPCGPVAWLKLLGRYEAEIDVIVTSEPLPFDDFGLLVALGIELGHYKTIITKSTLNALLWHDTFLRDFPSAQTIFALTPGITTPDLTFFDYQSVTRPKWPLDTI